FLDSDDILLPTSVECRLKVSEERKDCVVHSECYVLRKDLRRELFGVPKMQGYIYADLLARCGPVFPGMLISAKSFAEIGGLDEEVVAFQEWDTAIRLARLFPFMFVPEPTFIYDCTGTDTISMNLLNGARGYEYVVHKHLAAILLRAGPRTISEHYITIANQ